MPRSPSIPSSGAVFSDPRVQNFLRAFEDCKDTQSRIELVHQALLSPAATLFRHTVGLWVVENLVPVSSLVPENYAKWRPPVRDAMLFVIEHLSSDRLAPKIVEQFELPPRTPAERRLLRLISRVPALQKLGQIISRNRNLSRQLRAALSRLENGIHDVSIPEVRDHILKQLGPRTHEYRIRLRAVILAEGSVSAIVRFSWYNPETHRRERGILKVLKPWIRAYFREDLNILEDLAKFFGKHHDYKVGRGIIPDTFRKVRRHLQHEVDFAGEQRALVEAAKIYASHPLVSVPKLIPALSISDLTAMTEERGINVARVRDLTSRKRTAISEQLVDAVILTPLLSSDSSVLFHADPHPGNLLYDARQNRLALIDWALSDHLSLKDRRYLLKLFLSIGLRDPYGTTLAVQALAERPISRQDLIRVKRVIDDFIRKLPLAHIPDALDPMLLLEEIAALGIRFPSPLILFSKVLFTLSGILDDLGHTEEKSLLTIMRKISRQTSVFRRTLASPLRVMDWASVPVSAALFLGRVLLAAEESVLNKVLLPSADLIENRQAVLESPDR